MTENRKHIVLPRPAGNDAPFSEAVLVGDTLYIGGHIGLDAKTGRPGATAEEEARLMMDGMKRTIEAAGMEMNDLVAVQVFCSDVAHFDVFNSVYRTYFSGKYPSRAFLGSGKLLFDARFEAQGIAVRGK